MTREPLRPAPVLMRLMPSPGLWSSRSYAAGRGRSQEDRATLGNRHDGHPAAPVSPLARSRTTFGQETLRVRRAATWSA